MSIAYIVPDNPADPETAALELIVRLTGRHVGHRRAFTAALQNFCGLLRAEGAFTGLSWADAKAVAHAVSFDVTRCEDAAGVLRNRARDALAGDNMLWDDPDGVAQALNIAAATLGRCDEYAAPLRG